MGLELGALPATTALDIHSLVPAIRYQRESGLPVHISLTVEPYFQPSIVTDVFVRNWRRTRSLRDGPDRTFVAYVRLVVIVNLTARTGFVSIGGAGTVLFLTQKEMSERPVTEVPKRITLTLEQPDSAKFPLFPWFAPRTRMKTPLLSVKTCSTILT